MKLRRQIADEDWGSDYMWKSITGRAPGQYTELMDYAKFRATGYDKFYSFSAAFGYEFDDFRTDIEKRAIAIETTATFRQYYYNASNEFKVDKKAVESLAFSALLEIIRSDDVTGPSRLKAIEQACSLAGVDSIVPEDKEKYGSSMGDFYDDIGTSQARGKPFVSRTPSPAAGSAAQRAEGRKGTKH
ncbi:hypothetical protein [Pantoea sp. A4]|uniref:hypothetical protein n=1 Tax=Pantoea sp. A4 TaxID=1225184 RepID=UPI00035EDCD3|nr:hypothetical protein [Pantoea sp. A4]